MDRKRNNVTSQNTYEFRVLRHEHIRYACCACIKEKQIVVTTELCNQRL